MPSIDLPAGVRTADKIMVIDYHTSDSKVYIYASSAWKALT